HRHVPADHVLNDRRVGHDPIDLGERPVHRGFHSFRTSGDSPPCCSAFGPTRISSGAGMDRPLTSASPVDSAGNSSMSCRLSMSDAFTMKFWSSGFLSRMTIRVLHWLVTSASSLLGRWLTIADPTPNFRPSDAI